MIEKKSVGKKYEYYLNDKLGTGSFAEVVKGKNKKTDEVVAIKIIKRSVLAKYGDEIMNQIQLEVKILQQLASLSQQSMCPFINRIYEFLETANNFYIVLEYCNQGTLYDQIKKVKKIEEKEAIFILFQLLQALSLISNNNIAHRDIKPENIFIKDGVYKLGDFGFASQKSLYQTHLGTFPYMAPEFFNSDNYNTKVDVWALGLLTHEILFGEIYYIGRSQFEVQQKILTKPYLLNDRKYKISEQFKNLLYKMINKDQKTRISAQEALMDPIFDFCKNDPRYLDIMKAEKLNQHFEENSEQVEQISLLEDEDKLKKELEQQKKKEQKEQQELQEYQKLQQEKIISEKNQFIQNGIKGIKEGILDKIAGITLMVQLADYLNENIQQLCRFEILYILKQAAILIQQLKDRLEQQAILGKHDHVKIQFDCEIWMHFYEDRNLLQFIDEIEEVKNQIKKKYIDYVNIINYFSLINFPTEHHKIESIANLNLTKPIDLQLYQEQLFLKMQFLKQDSLKTENQFIKQQIDKCILWMYAAYEFQKLCSGELFDIKRFIQAIINDDVEEMKCLTLK
ncbi:unnamed protein product [Paramecium sonneborni]|uniref:Protein kinase domain-containing protein n=1 Tax=Paramecium sonneborni TaxID=65129 RepID=A0A8S1QIJ8_9CILI|nr:unnamed protein product [Paramecium sonneborni]